MNSQSRLFRKDYSYELLNLAGEDAHSAEILLNGQGRKETVLFMVQQSVEKALKAVICHKESPVPLSHSLELLAANTQEPDIPHLSSFADLTPYATIRRYEEGVYEVTLDEAEAGIRIAKEVLDWARDKVSSK